MGEDNKILTLFTTRMRQMILQHQEVKKENEDLYAMVDSRDAEIKELKEKLDQAQKDYNSLKMARMVEITDEEIYYRNAAKLINDTVNTYSGLLKGKKSEKEILYAAMLVIALKYESEKGHNDTSEYDDILKRLTKEIEAVL